MSWVGRNLSKVEIERLLGRGGMAEVYLGRHTTLNRPVAVKILHGHLSNDDVLLQRFRSEAQAVANLRHPNIVQVFDFDVVDGQPYIVMELLEGPSLDDYLRSQQRMNHPLAPETLARLITFIAAALDYAHSRGIVHRDVKPSNVLLRRESGTVDVIAALPDDVMPVLTDFGVARLANATVQTASGMIVGTPAYMSPEQVTGEVVDSRSDIYSLGIMLYQMLSGKLPFESDSEAVASTLIKHITEPPPPLPNLPPALQAVVFRALEKDRNNRYQKAGELAADLRGALGLPLTPTDLVMITPGGSARLKSNVTVSPARPGRIRPSRAVLTLAVLVVLLVVGAAGILLGQSLLDDDKDTSAAPPAGPETFGTLSFGSETYGTVDQVKLSVQGLAPPPEGMQYEVWLLGSETRRSIGSLTVDETGSGELVFVDRDAANLLASYGGFEITQEPGGDVNPLPAGDGVYSGMVANEPLMHVRHLLVSFGNAPDQIGLTTGVMVHAQLIADSIDKAQTAQDNGDLEALKREAEALVNLIDGDGGQHFGDLDGDGEVTNPGDGFGLLPGSRSTGYIQSSIEHARYAVSAPGANDLMKAAESKLEAAAQNVGGWVALLRDEALVILDSTSLDEAAPHLTQAAAYADLLMHGQDVNGNGMIEAISQEGGADTMYLYAQGMAEMTVVEGMSMVVKSSPIHDEGSIMENGMYQ